VFSAHPSKVPSHNLDILRSIAVGIVFISHLTLSLNGGSFFLGPFDLRLLGRSGVLIFFVHTALVLMLSMERMGETGGALFKKFYIRRLFRIYPLSILLCIVVSLFRLPPNVLGDPFIWSWPKFLMNVLLVQNVTDPGQLSDPLWSLPFEVQMYLFLPMLYLAVQKPAWWKNLALFFLGSIAVLFLATWKHRLYLFMFWPCFLAGVLAYKLLTVRRAELPFWLWPLAVAGLVMAFVMAPEHLLNPAVLCVLLAWILPWFEDHPVGVTAKSAHLIARYSYGIYLCHYPLMWLFFRRLHDLPGGLLFAGFVLAMIILPVACYHLVEAPMINVGIFLANRLGGGKSSSVTVHPVATSRELLSIAGADPSLTGADKVPPPP
jgi:peptidoglycan/LPS O-acetylase OafA/YrhL